jgi:putative membrane protein
MKMKSNSLSILNLAIVAIAAGILCFAGTVSAAVDTTSTADNPHLRPQVASATDKSTLSAKDKSFIQAAAAGNEYEVEDGKMALKQGQSAEVKKIAARMVSDHTKALNELVALAKKKGIGVTTGTIKAQDLGTKDFDKQYLRLLERDHKKDIAEFEKQAKTGSDSELKSWAAKTLPMMKGHLAMVQAAMKK